MSMGIDYIINNYQVSYGGDELPSYHLKISQGRLGDLGMLDKTGQGYIYAQVF